MKRRWWLALGAALGLLLSGCSAAATPAAVTPTALLAPTGIPATSAPAATAAPTGVAGTPAPTAGGTATAPASTLVVPTAPPGTLAPTGAPTPAATIEPRVIEAEWPPQMRLGDSDLIRLAIIPSDKALTVTTEFENHTTITQSVVVERQAGYDLYGVARLDAAGFSVEPPGDQAQALVTGQAATWRWTVRPLNSGQQRVALNLRLRWVPQARVAGGAHETVIYDRGLTIRVVSFLGLTTREVTAGGVFGLLFGITLSLPLAAYLVGPRRSRDLFQVLRPNAAVDIELPPGLALTPAEAELLRALFQHYGRLVVEAEFRSGYSGARTFLARPIRPDGRADAYTIAKIGESGAIRREFENYEAHVKDTLPPVTARIQATPVVTDSALAGRRPAGRALQPASAALRYTFIGEPGQSPTSLRQALLAQPNPALLEKLFATFGPNWWMQRRPYTFRLGLEYDRLLPTHFVLEPITSGAPAARPFDARVAPAGARLQVGDVIQLQHVRTVELRPDARSLSLAGEPVAGQPPLRLRWLSLAPPAGTAARVVATRETLLREWVAGFDLYGLPDPLVGLPGLLNETLAGTQSTIHGDLNLENALVGPGGFVWLIDFAQTRDGHTLYDFAYLEACLIGQVISPAIPGDDAFMTILERDDDPLRASVHNMVRRCLFNPEQWREYQLALYVACLGALKFYNLDRRQKHRLYLAAAHLSRTL